MNTILNEFKGSLDRIKNNFYFSFLSINFAQNKPFANDIILPVQMANNIMAAVSLNNFDNDGINEFANSIRRHFLNDIVIAYERYSMLMFASHQNGKTRIDPATINDRNLGAHKFENLANIYTQTELDFLIQLRRLRNSIVHYNGVYSSTNVLNYTFDTEPYNSTGNEGQSISINFDSILWIYDRIIEIVENGNTNYFIHY
jgi:hypothetical protein